MSESYMESGGEIEKPRILLKDRISKKILPFFLVGALAGCGQEKSEEICREFPEIASREVGTGDEYTFEQSETKDFLSEGERNLLLDMYASIPARLRNGFLGFHVYDFPNADWQPNSQYGSNQIWINRKRFTSMDDLNEDDSIERVHEWNNILTHETGHHVDTFAMCDKSGDYYKTIGVEGDLEDYAFFFQLYQTNGDTFRLESYLPGGGAFPKIFNDNKEDLRKRYEWFKKNIFQGESVEPQNIEAGLSWALSLIGDYTPTSKDGRVYSENVDGVEDFLKNNESLLDDPNLGDLMRYISVEVKKTRARLNDRDSQTLELLQVHKEIADEARELLPANSVYALEIDFDLAKHAQLAGEYALALSLFQHVSDNSKDLARQLDAKNKMAAAYIFLEDFASAAKIYKDISTRYKDTWWGNKAAEGLEYAQSRM